jgi:hypothetical protein
MLKVTFPIGKELQIKVLGIGMMMLGRLTTAQVMMLKVTGMRMLSMSTDSLPCPGTRLVLARDSGNGWLESAGIGTGQSWAGCSWGSLRTASLPNAHTRMTQLLNAKNIKLFASVKIMQSLTKSKQVSPVCTIQKLRVGGLWRIGAYPVTGQKEELVDDVKVVHECE